MRPCSLQCAIVAILVSASSYQTSTAQQNWLRQAIAPENRIHDFGTVARAANTEHRFYIKNVLDQEMHIRSVRASCGCTTPIIETKTIAPGETGSILARFNTGTFTGQKKATLTVSIDRPYYTELQLNVGGYIRSDIVLSPGEIQFGQLSEGDGKSIQLFLDYAGRNDWKLEQITSPHPFVAAKFEEVSRSAGRIRYSIQADLTADAPIGFLQNQLVLHTNDRRMTSVPLRFNADIKPSIELSPQKITLGDIKPGASSRQRLVVKGQRPFRILDITSDAAQIDFEPTSELKKAHLVNIVITPQNTAITDSGLHLSESKGQILIKTDLADEPLKMGLTFKFVTQSPSPVQVGQAIK